MRKVVISGATSMIGLALIDKCLKENVDILALVNKNSSRKGRSFECDMAKVNEINMQKNLKIMKFLSSSLGGNITQGKAGY